MPVILVSVLILVSGDYSARLQFNGPIKTEIRGELLDDAKLKSEKSCEVFARFNEVKLKPKSQIENFIKINFKFVCTQDGHKKTYRLAPEFVRSSDLTSHSASVYISKRFKKNTLKIENFSLQ